MIQVWISNRRNILIRENNNKIIFTDYLLLKSKGINKKNRVNYKNIIRRNLYYQTFLTFPADFISMYYQELEVLSFRDLNRLVTIIT